MRAKFFLAWLGACLALTASAQSMLEKPVSLAVTDTEVRQVLTEIQKQVNVKFVYSPSAIPVLEKVSIQVSQAQLKDVLDNMLKPLGIGFNLVNNHILLFKAEDNLVADKSQGSMNAERWIAHAVSGTVVDATTRQAMPGVNVLIKNTMRGTATDVNGKYTLETAEGDVLLFSFIGFATYEIAVDGRTTIDVSMEENISALKEVVITGYQEIRKESFTGTAITVSGEDLKKVNPVNIFQSIQAYDPSFKVIQNNAFGSNPNKLPDINVRGASGLPSSAGDIDKLNKNGLQSNPNLPTFILDGFEVTLQTIYDLDINRVASVTLLKDAAATAVYGSRAANGVLVITTHKPEEGKLQLFYNYEMNVTGPDLSVYNVLNASDKLEYERLAGLYDANVLQSTLSQGEFDELYYNKKKSVLSGVDTYWLSEPVETAIGHKNSLSIQGGSKATRYALTAYNHQLPGVMKSSGRKRYGGDIKLIHNLNDKLLFSNDLSVNFVKSTESPYGNFADYVRMNPYYLKRDEKGNIIREVDSWVTRGTVDNQNSLITSGVLNPLYDATLNSKNQSAYTQIINSFSTVWNITNGLTLRGLLNFTKYDATTDIFKSPFRNEYQTETDPKKRGEYTFGTTGEFTLDGNAVLSYNKELGKHFLNASLGGNFRDYRSDFKKFVALGYSNDRFPNIDFANRYSDDPPTGIYIHERLASGFLSVNYSYDNKYLLDVAARLDGSSKFGTDNKVAPFWATGIGWNLHKEDFLSGATYIDQLKLRASTGLTGVVAFPAYQAQTTYQYFNDWYSTGIGVEPMGYGNENLRWQRTHNYDVGIDATLFNNRIMVSPRYYYKITDDLLADIVVPPSLGYLAYKDNLGQMQNTGFELNFMANVVRAKDWTVNITSNLVHNENKIRRIANSLKKYNDEADEKQIEEDYQSVPLLRFQEGQSLNTIYAVRSLGIDPENGKEIFMKKDGSLTYDYDVKDIVAVGNSSPKVEGFFGTNISYRNFMLMLSFYTRWGGDVYNQTLIDRVENADPRYNVDQRVLDQRWKQPGDQVFFKNIADQNPTKASSRFIQADDVIELRTLALSYETPRFITQKLAMQMLRFTVTMNDPWRWSAVTMERGIEYPFARMVTFSLQSRF
ncbi:SusC/RagA family TonB-linked outer membrane protein [Chryseolinea lacunae]|uniref:SusC/RagA family TonB-linked outer membrane protein n=1 Tax=Chryseolinea lacunae TaxID=2801331 RepID=A0ABS1KUT6_9BACT|nr:SusC/RagA family TonB-linked outer membrane protein [Chryseolinea lacunae]MBL0742997.1 SusC/RagA family TonB-linked outer membrane protein [Chryseolinea lacunae]